MTHMCRPYWLSVTVPVVLGIILTLVLPSVARSGPLFPLLDGGHLSDVVGVRSNLDPSSITANFLDFSTSTIVADGTITETVPETPETATVTFSTSGLALPANDVLHPLRTGTSFLMEGPILPGVVSDEVTLSVVQNALQLDWTLTLISDPANYPLGATGFNESGFLQDLSGDLFILSGLITPLDPAIGVQLPFHVVAASDVPEPGSLLLLGTGLAAVVSRVRRRRSQPNMSQ